MVKYKSRAPKAMLTSAEAQQAAKEAAEARRLEEEARCAEELKEAECKRKEWDALPGPLPMGWYSSLGKGCGREFYWQVDHPQTTTTWDRPVTSGEKVTDTELDLLLEEYRHTDKPPRAGMFAFAVQRLWEREEVDPICNLQRPGSKGDQELCDGMKLLRYILRGPRRDYQDWLAQCRHLPHEKLPPHMHHVTAIQRIVDLLRHDSADVKAAAANLIGAACFGGHRGCQDAFAMLGDVMPLLIDMLWDERTIQAACLCMGRLCEGCHRFNQDALVMVPAAPEYILKHLEHQEESVVRAVHFCIFWACASAAKGTRATWERSRGMCLSLTEPKPPADTFILNRAEAARCHRAGLLQDLETAAETKQQRAEVNEEKRRHTVTYAEKVLALFDKVPEPEDVPGNAIAKKMGKVSKQMHIPISSHQDPSHVHMHLSTKRSLAVQKDHEVRHSVRHKTILLGVEDKQKDLHKDKDGQKALALTDGEAQAAAESVALALPSDGRKHRRSELAWEYGDVIKEALEETSSEEEDHDIHHVDPALEDDHTCRIGNEVRFVATTGFLHPQSSNKRFGVCT